MKFLSKIFGDPNSRVISMIQPVIDEINALEPEIEKCNFQSPYNRKFGDSILNWKFGDSIP